MIKILLQKTTIKKYLSLNYKNKAKFQKFAISTKKNLLFFWFILSRRRRNSIILTFEIRKRKSISRNFTFSSNSSNLMRKKKKLIDIGSILIFGILFLNRLHFATGFLISSVNFCFRVEIY